MKFTQTDRQNSGKFILIAVSAVAVIAFLLISNNLVKAARYPGTGKEWISGRRPPSVLAKANVDSDFEFLLGIISQNNSIPVLISDTGMNISEFRNFDLPRQRGCRQITFLLSYRPAIRNISRKAPQGMRQRINFQGRRP